MTTNKIPVRSAVTYTDRDGIEQNGTLTSWLRHDDGAEQTALVSRQIMQSTIMETVPASKLRPATKTNDTEFIHAEMRLAQALGWTNLKIVTDTVIGTPPDGLHSVRGEAVVPRWCRDWGACGALMTQYGCYPRDSCFGSIVVDDAEHRTAIYLRAAAYPTKDDAMRYAIVRAVTLKIGIKGGAA